MNYDTVDNVLWPYEQTTSTVCEACYKPLSEIEQSDPITFEGKVFCDQCGSDVANLRNQGYIGLASDKTKALVKGSKQHFVKFLKDHAAYNAFIRNFKEQNPLWKNHWDYLSYYHPKTWLTGAFYISETYEGASYWIKLQVKWEAEL